MEKGDADMLVKNTPENRELQKVCASMAIEEMYLSEDFVKKLMQVNEGTLTYEQLKQETLKEYSDRENCNTAYGRMY